MQPQNAIINHHQIYEQPRPRTHVLYPRDKPPNPAHRLETAPRAARRRGTEGGWRRDAAPMQPDRRRASARPVGLRRYSRGEQLTASDRTSRFATPLIKVSHSSPHATNTHRHVFIIIIIIIRSRIAQLSLLQIIIITVFVSLQVASKAGCTPITPD